jgi:hypothetical protein
MTADLSQRETAEAVAEQLRIVAQPTRLMILSLLRGGERSVSDIEPVAATGRTAPSGDGRDPAGRQVDLLPAGR